MKSSHKQTSQRHASLNDHLFEQTPKLSSLFVFALADCGKGGVNSRIWTRPYGPRYRIAEYLRKQLVFIFPVGGTGNDHVGVPHLQRALTHG